MSDIQDALNDLDIWLSSNAPIDLENLRPPASEQELAEVEQTVGLPLPEEIRLLYKWHNGSGDTEASCVQLIPEWPFLSLAGSITHWRKRNLQYQDDLDDTGACFWWKTSWLPLAYDFTGELFVVELSPTASNHRAVFWASIENGPRFDYGWPSLEYAIDDVADTLAAESPKPLRDNTPVLEAGRLVWRFSGQ